MPVTEPTLLAPDQVLAKNDPGDATEQRYRFQHTWAATASCMLLDDTQDVCEIFCEHHEDILLKHHDGTFTGEQVKTRDSSQPIWKASDSQVRDAFARFVRLEAEHPGHFRAYRFLTNHPLHVANNAQSIGYVLSEIAKASEISNLPSPVKTWLKRIARDVDVSEPIAFGALKKATASDKLPKLTDSTMRLVHALVGCWSGAKECPHVSVERAAYSLIDECARAASLDHLQLLPAYLLVTDSPNADVLARINGKRLTAKRVVAVLDHGMSATASLAGAPDKWTEPGQGSTDLMLRKLDAGGFSAVSRNAAENLRDKADYLAITWTKKFGREGLGRYEHIRTIALSDAAKAFEATKAEGKYFGPEMQENLRARFKARRTDNEQLFDCSNDHLEGFAYSLTSQCKVQWSIDRPWEDD